MRKLILICTALLGVSTLAAQNKRAWEWGIGGSVYQFNRISDVQFTPSAENNAVDVKLRHVVYSGNLYAARELSNAFALDFQGSLGKIEKEWLTHLGLGLQWRLGHYFRSSLIDPYFRVGAGYLYKGHHILYSGNRNGARWTMFNDHNKDGADAQHIVPVSAGLGINMWLGDRVGIGMQGDYLYMPKKDVANSLQGTVRIIFRFGGESRRPAPVVHYLDRPVEKIVEKIVEGPAAVQRLVEVEKVVETDKIIGSIHFDYDSYAIRAASLASVRNMAELLLKDTDQRYLITGYTDVRGGSGYNLRLSEQRAQALRDALVAQGVPAFMLKIKGAGRRVSHVSGSESDKIREGDRKATIELITNREYWDQL